MMERLRETLTGRSVILELYSLSAREKAGMVFDTDLMRDVAEAGDITLSTTKEWLKVLVGLHIVYLLAPYSNN